MCNDLSNSFCILCGRYMLLKLEVVHVPISFSWKMILNQNGSNFTVSIVKEAAEPMVVSKRKSRCVGMARVVYSLAMALGLWVRVREQGANALHIFKWLNCYPSFVGFSKAFLMVCCSFSDHETALVLTKFDSGAELDMKSVSMTSFVLHHPDHKFVQTLIRKEEDTHVIRNFMFCSSIGLFTSSFCIEMLRRYPELQVRELFRSILSLYSTVGMM